MQKLKNIELKKVLVNQFVDYLEYLQTDFDCLKRNKDNNNPYNYVKLHNFFTRVEHIKMKLENIKNDFLRKEKNKIEKEEKESEIKKSLKTLSNFENKKILNWGIEKIKQDPLINFNLDVHSLELENMKFIEDELYCKYDVSIKPLTLNHTLNVYHDIKVKCKSIVLNFGMLEIIIPENKIKNEIYDIFTVSVGLLPSELLNKINQLE